MTTAQNALARGVVACLLSLAAALPLAAKAQGLARHSLRMDSEDLALLRTALNDVLEHHRVGGSASWTNSRTGISGTATAERFYRREGRDCADVDAVLTTTRKVAQRNYTLVMCRTPEGWKLGF